MVDVTQDVRAFDAPRIQAFGLELVERPAQSAAPVAASARKSAKSTSEQSGIPAAPLILKFVLINLAAFALLGAAVGQGWVGKVVEADSTGLSIGIFGVFLAGLAVCAVKIWVISRDTEGLAHHPERAPALIRSYLADVKGRSAGSRALSASALKLTLGGRISTIRHIANSLVLLGLIGTVLGFIIALSGVDANAASDVTAIAPMVTELISGMSVALYTTLVGAVFNLWLMVNYQLLQRGATHLASELIALGEAAEKPQTERPLGERDR